MAESASKQLLSALTEGQEKGINKGGAKKNSKASGKVAGSGKGSGRSVASGGQTVTSSSSKCEFEGAKADGIA